MAVFHLTGARRVSHLHYKCKNIRPLRSPLGVCHPIRHNRVSHRRCIWRTIHLRQCHMVVCHLTGLHRHYKFKIIRLRSSHTGVSHLTGPHRVGQLRYQCRSILRWFHMVVCTGLHRGGRLHCIWRIIHLHPCHMEVCPPTGPHHHSQSRNIHLRWSLAGVCHLIVLRPVNRLRCKCMKSGKTLPLPLRHHHTESSWVVRTPTLLSRQCIPRHEVIRRYHPCTHPSIAHTLLTRHHIIHAHHDPPRH